MTIIWPEDVAGKTREEQLALVACWFVGISDSATDHGMASADVVAALEMAKEELAT